MRHGFALLTWLVLASMTTWSAAGDGLVYESAFEAAKDASRWDGGRFDEAANQLGPFRNEATTLKLTDLPPHAAVRVRVHLVIEGGWTGETFANADGSVIGPDQWGLRVVGAATLIHTTFSNHADHAQAFPASWRQSPSPARSTASSSRTGTPDRSTYHLDYTLRHDATTLAIRMYGTGLGPADTWSVDRVRIDLLDKLPAPPDTSPDAIAALIRRLHEGDAESSQAAAWMLANIGESAIKPLIASLKHVPAAAVADDEPLALVKQLDADEFAEREAATDKLKALSTDEKRSLKAITDRMELTLEQRWRLGEVYKSLSGEASGHRAVPPPPSVDEQHRDRIVRVLELMHLPAATEAARGEVGLATALDVLGPGVVFEGVGGQDGYPSYPLHLTIDRHADGKVHGQFHWKTLRDSRSKIKGTLDDHRLAFTEYELISGGGIVIPVEYNAVLVGQMITGVWHSGGKTTAFYGRMAPPYGHPQPPQ